MIIGLGLTTVIAIISILNPYIAGAIVDDVIKGENRTILYPLVACSPCSMLSSGSFIECDAAFYSTAFIRRSFPKNAF
jgi:hypothetical protein